MINFNNQDNFKIKNALVYNQSAMNTDKSSNFAPKNSQDTKDFPDNWSQAVRSAGLSIVKNDNDVLKGIIDYGKIIREKRSDGKISLSRNPLWDCDIPYQQNNYYRMIGDGGYSDILENNIIRAKQNTKENYSCSYFEKGRANSIYARRGGANYILEVPSDCTKIITNPNAYPSMEPVKADDIKYRIWHLKDDKHYEIVADTINDVISRHPDFRFKD